MNEKIDLFIRWFETQYPLADKISSVRIYENTESTYEEIADELTSSATKKNMSEEKKKCSSIIFGFGYAVGSVISRNRNVILTHQHRFKDTPVWTINVASLLNIKPESVFFTNGFDGSDDIDVRDLRDAGIGEFLKWLSNPNGNVEISGKVFKSMTTPMIHEVSDKMPGKSSKSITIAIPPFSSQLDSPNWEELLEDINIGNVKIEIVPTSSLYFPDINERLYIVWKHSWFFDSCYIIEAIELSDDGVPIQIASYSFQESNPEKYYPLKEIDRVSVNVDAMRAAGDFVAPKKDDYSTDFMVEPKFPVENGMLAFLGKNSSSFCYEFYSLKENAKPETDMEEKVASLMRISQSAQVAVLCGKICGENNMLNISLSDMVSVGIALDNKKIFSPTTMTNKTGEVVLGTKTNIFPKQDIKFEQLPANYYSFTWKYLKKDFDRNSYAKVSLDEVQAKYKNDGNLDDILGMLAEYFSPAKTDTIAEELLYIFDEDATPTARFVAGLFWYLANNPLFSVESKSEVIQGFENLETKVEPNVVKNALPPKVVRQGNSNVRKPSIFTEGPTKIEDLGLSVRSYNSLRRAKIYTVKQLSEMSETKLSRVRNLGNNGVKEIKEKLSKIGIYLKS